MFLVTGQIQLGKTTENQNQMSDYEREREREKFIWKNVSVSFQTHFQHPIRMQDEYNCTASLYLANWNTTVQINLLGSENYLAQIRSRPESSWKRSLLLTTYIVLISETSFSVRVLSGFSRK